MTVKRTFRGIGNHTYGDMIYVSAWVGKPDEFLPNMDKSEAEKWISRTFGGSLGGIIGMPSVFLDEDLYVWKICARWGELCSNPDEECRFREGDICRPPRFAFDATVEISRVEEAQDGNESTTP